MSKWLLLLVSVFTVSMSSAEVVERVIAVVNSEPILESDLTALKSRARTTEFLYPFLLPAEPALITRGDRKALLDYLVGEKILQNEIKRLNLEVTSEKVEAEVKGIAKRNNVSVDELYTQVRREGLSKSEYQQTMKDGMERQSLLEQEIVSKIRVSDDDALAEYMAGNREAKMSVNEFTVSHIFFDPKKGGGEAAYERAESTLRRLRSGESFEALAGQFSEDPNFSSGGTLGTFKSGEFLPEIENSIASLSAGQTTGIIRSRLGLHLVKLNSKKMSQDPRFEKEKDRIKARLLEKLVQRQFRIWLQTKKDDSYVRINDK